MNNNESLSIQILLLTTQYSASGINLENTSDIVLYHSMSEDKTKQIIGRGQRPGRTNQLHVWKLHYENEVNEKQMKDFKNKKFDFDFNT